MDYCADEIQKALDNLIDWGKATANRPPHEID